jgi:hypothetical protein
LTSLFNASAVLARFLSGIARHFGDGHRVIVSVGARIVMYLVILAAEHGISGKDA